MYKCICHCFVIQKNIPLLKISSSLSAMYSVNLKLSTFQINIILNLQLQYITSLHAYCHKDKTNLIPLYFLLSKLFSFDLLYSLETQKYKSYCKVN